MTPILTIIIPCYKVEKYLNRCMETIVNQVLRNIEIILIDDGSPDNVPELCEYWAQKDSRIKVIHKRNEGLGYARNSGLEIAKGKYVAFVDSDDYVDKEMYHTLIEEAEKKQLDAVFCGYKKEQQNGQWIPVLDFSQKKIMLKEEFENYVLSMMASSPHIKKERLYTMSVWHAIYKRSIIECNDIRFYSERDIVSEDIPFQVDFMQNANIALYVPIPFYNYCLNDASLSSTFKEEKYDKFMSLRILLLNKLKYSQKASLHINRLIIGFTRSYIQSLLISKHTNKIKVIRHIVNDNVWTIIKKVYKPSYLPIYQGLFYKLILLKKVSLIYVLAYISMKAKIYLGKKI